MSTVYHIIVTGSRPEKVGNKFQPMPQANIDFIEATLAKVAPEDYAFLYHGAANGVDTVADNWAFRNGVHIKQFPAYWFDPTKEKNVNKGAGLFRNEAMVRQAIDDVYGKEDHAIVLLGFYNTQNLADSRGTNHCVEYATKRGLTTRTFQLPVLKATTVQVNAEAATAGTMPNPFG